MCSIQRSDHHKSRETESADYSDEETDVKSQHALLSSGRVREITVNFAPSQQPEHRDLTVTTHAQDTT